LLDRNRWTPGLRRYIDGHQNRGENGSRWKGGKIKSHGGGCH